jgi:hypothetical protein
MVVKNRWSSCSLRRGCCQQSAKLRGTDRARHYGSPGEEATRERDQVINPAVAGAWTAPDRVKRAATARYDAKVTAARTKYDKDCGNAEAELARMLDQREVRGLG